MNLPNKKEALADFKFRLKNLKEEKKDDSSKTVAKTEVKKEEPTRKLYCN